MRILNEKPPVWDNACAAFQINPKQTVFTYGDTIYNPSGIRLSEDLIAHETIHMQQQSINGPALWWGEYLRDPEFRVHQEAWAYAAQFAFLMTKHSDRNQRIRILIDLARKLSSPLYASAVSYKDAMELIQKYANYSILK